MSPLTQPVPVWLREAPRPREAARAPVRTRAWIEPLAVFAVAYAAYAAVGLYTTLRLHVVVGDAESRLAHAYFVWANSPRKLAAIGFIWPPIQTLLFLPLALVRPLATSLAALPLTSAIFGAGLVVVLVRAFADAGIARPLRWALGAAVGLNPLLLFYASNGMAEIVYLFFLTWAFVLFLRWLRDYRWQQLAGIGAVMGIGVLTRYELVLWLPLLVAGVCLVLARRTRSLVALESAALVLSVVTVYGLAVWIFVNATIVGEPVGFISSQFPGGAVRGQPGFGTLADAASITLATLRVHLLVFPIVLPLAALLLVLARRRGIVPLVLALALLVNPLTTLALALHSRLPVLLQLRYNLRALPLAVVALAWLVSIVPARRRRVAAAAALVVVAASAVGSAIAMLTPADASLRYSYGLGERSFLAGLATGADQEARPGPAGASTPVRAQQEMASWIRARIPGRNVVLTDDARTYGVMLADGHPDRYFDRIDRGDEKWLEVVRAPVGRVDYLLVERNATRARDVVFFDRIIAEHPGLGPRGAPPKFARRVHANAVYALYNIQRAAP